MGNICNNPNKKKNDYFLHLTIKEFIIEKSNGFFNFKALSKDIKMHHFYIKNDFILMLDSNKKIYKSIDIVKNFMINNYTENLLNIGFKINDNNQIEIYKPYEIEQKKLHFEKNMNISKFYLRNYKNDFWFVVKENQSIEIKKDMVIKIGRLRMKLKKIKIYDNGNGRKNSLHKKIKFSNKNTNLCRICLENEDEENRFFNNCACTKTMPIHGSCLWQWISKNITKKEKYIFINNKFLCCDICKNEYPIYMNINGENRLIFDDHLNTSFAIFNSYDNLTNKLKGIYIIYMKNGNKLTIGRNQNCDIILKDLSISRNHSYILIKNNKLFIHEYQSKFGTLFYHKDYLMDNSLSIQYDKFHIDYHFNIKEFNCCNNKKFKFTNYSLDRNYNLTDEISNKIRNYKLILEYSLEYKSSNEDYSYQMDNNNDVKNDSLLGDENINMIENNNINENNNIIDDNINISNNDINNNSNNDIDNNENHESINSNIELDNNENHENNNSNIIINDNSNHENNNSNNEINHNLNNESNNSNIINNNNSNHENNHLNNENLENNSNFSELSNNDINNDVNINNSIKENENNVIDSSKKIINYNRPSLNIVTNTENNNLENIEKSINEKNSLWIKEEKIENSNSINKSIHYVSEKENSLSSKLVWKNINNKEVIKSLNYDESINSKNINQSIKIEDKSFTKKENVKNNSSVGIEFNENFNESDFNF